MGKLVQFQTSAVNMTLSLREQLRRAQLCILDEFNSPQGRLIVSDLEWLHGRVRATEDQLQPISRREPFNSDIFIDQLPGKRVQIVQPVRVSLSTIPQLIQAGPSKPAVLEAIELHLIFNLQVSSVEDEVSLRISLTRIEGEAAELPQFAPLGARILAQFPATTIPIDTARLAGLESRPKVANVGIAAAVADSVPTAIADPQARLAPLPTESVILVRIEIGNAPVDTTGWGNFFTDPASALFTSAAPRARSWAIFTDEFFVRAAITRGTERSLAASDQFKLQGGVASTWTVPDEAHAHVHLDFYGRAVKACGPLTIRMSVNVRVELSTLPAASDAALDPDASPGMLHQFVKINHWKNDLDTALCLVAAKAIWPYLGPKLMDEDHLSWFELITSFLLPPATTIFLLKLANKGGMLPAPLPTCVRPDPEKDEFNCTRPFQADIVAFGGRSLLEGMQAMTNGMVLHGSISWFERLGRALTLSPPVSSAFQLSASNTGCNRATPTGLALADQHPELFVAYEASVDITFELEPLTVITDPAARVISTGRTLNAMIPSQICSVRVRPEDDRLNVFAPYVTLNNVHRFGGNIRTRVPVASVPDAYFTPAHRYPCRLLVQTTAGARIISIPPLVRATADEVRNAAVGTWAQAVSNCYAKSKRWEPKWIIDPADFYRVVQRWDVLVSGLQPLEQTRFETRQGQIVAAATADRQGTAWMHAVLLPDAYDGHLIFQRSGATEDLPEVDTETAAEILASRRHPVIDARQSQLLLVAEIALDDSVIDVAPMRLDSGPALAIASRDTVALYGIGQLTSPVLLARRSMPGIVGVASTRGQLLAAGRDGTFEIRFDPETTELLAVSLSSTPAVAAVSAGDCAVTLHEGSIYTWDAGRGQRVDIEGLRAQCIGASRSHVLVGSAEAVDVFEFGDQGLRHVANYGVHNLRRILSPSLADESSRFVIDTGEDAEYIDITEEGVLSVKAPLVSQELHAIDAAGTGFFRMDRVTSRLQIFAVGRVAWQ